MYYAFSQDISRSHQGKVTGITGILAWAFSGVAQMAFGSSADATQSFNTGLIIVGLLPLFATLSLVFFWPVDRYESTS
jgi:nitrate/nitrite transporter NarK